MILQTLDESMIQPTFVQYKWYWHRWYILRYTHDQYLLIGVKVTLHIYFLTHYQKAWYLKEILNHTKNHPIRYQMYQLTRIQTQVFQILLFHVQFNHKMMGIINEYTMRKRAKINAGLRRVATTQSTRFQRLHSS